MTINIGKLKIKTIKECVDDPELKPVNIIGFILWCFFYAFVIMTILTIVIMLLKVPGVFFK
jgi:hypothetical protein